MKNCRAVLLEPLEARRLLAGVTILSHGYNGDVNGWVAAAADDIQTRAGGPDAASIYTLSVTAVGGTLAVSGFSVDDGSEDVRETTRSEMIVRLDWSSVDDGTYSTTAVGQTVADYFLAQADARAADAYATAAALIPELPIHLIGHSRGASLNVALSQALGLRGVGIEQSTFLDPHPVDGMNDLFGVNFDDAPMTVYDNVDYADNYWRTDGDPNNFDFDGEAVAGAFNGDLNASVQQQYVQSAHVAVTAYYVGTIDTVTSEGGDHPVFPAWYAGTSDKPARDATGFAMSVLGNGGRVKAGLAQALGGAGARTVVGQSGAQFGNVAGVKIVSGMPIAGNVLQLAARYSDRDSSTQIVFFLDTDRNPYNDTEIPLSSKTLAAGDNASGRLDAAVPSELTAGSYFLAAKTLDADGHVHYAYNAPAIAFKQPGVGTVSAGVLRIDGTPSGDSVSATNDGNDVTAVRNGEIQRFSAAALLRVEIYAGAGKDYVDLTGLTLPAYVDGGADADLVNGGDRNDTLTGGGGPNTLNGGEGNDRLNGSGGNDKLNGNNGDDRIYGNGGSDTLAGQGNVDRIFGGDGDDYLVGGNGNDKLYAGAGNDTLIGSSGLDILDGGVGGIDWADNDAADHRTDIEALLS